MPPTKPGPDPERTTPNLPALRPAKVWETGVAPNDTRIPGTRRLWLAGALALAVVSSCVTALMLQDSGHDDSSQNDGRTTAADDDRVLPSLSLPPTSPPATSAPDGKSGLSEPQEAKDSSKNGEGADKDSDDAKEPGSSESQQGGAKPTDEPSKSATPTRKPPSTTSLKSVRSVNYPDRYWHLRSGVIQLDQVSSRSGSETREDSSFKVVSGLANSSCYSFRMADGRYVRHASFVLRAASHDGSHLFKQDATFCPRSAYADSVMLESVNYPGYFVRHRNFQLRLDRYEHSGHFLADASYQLVKGLS
ncbi:AbfB domain-containing protein [Streptomyces sp. TG1A-60]|uniref:AbfB domain-containing protein n=1 Tax=Streptomyces sp. TG1A-60 TaxID=3129111 RepID=UPI0030D398E5